MARTVQCDRCGVVLNLPDNAGGKRLKCPKCGTKFVVDADTARYPKTERSDHDASPASSTVDIPREHGGLLIPTAPGDLRETFDLPLMTEADAGAAPRARAQSADALALFDERKPAARRPSAAEARAQARRCPTCGGVVPKGMSICSKCGLDLESGSRVQLDDDDLLPEAPARAAGLPFPVTVIGFVSLLGSVILAAFSAVQWLGGNQGWQYFVPICLFGAFASVHLLRGHSARLLLVALTLGAVVDVVALIATPIFQANAETRVIEGKFDPSDPEAEPVIIEPITERLDSQKLGLGIAVLLLYAAVGAYLASPSARRRDSGR